MGCVANLRVREEEADVHEGETWLFTHTMLYVVNTNRCAGVKGKMLIVNSSRCA